MKELELLGVPEKLKVNPVQFLYELQHNSFVPTKVEPKIYDNVICVKKSSQKGELSVFVCYDDSVAEDIENRIVFLGNFNDGIVA